MGNEILDNIQVTNLKLKVFLLKHYQSSQNFTIH